MASITLSSSFITCTTSSSSVYRSSFASDGRCACRSHIRAVPITCSTAYNKNQKQQNTEVKSSVAEGVQSILKNTSPVTNWWAPLFKFPSEGTWASVLLQTEREIVELTSPYVTVPDAVPAATAVSLIQENSISSPDLILESNHIHVAAAAAAPTAGLTLIQRESTSLPDIIASSKQKSNPQGKQVVFDDKKARELRRKLRGLETYHDCWVHSAIASRLAEPED